MVLLRFFLVILGRILPVISRGMRNDEISMITGVGGGGDYMIREFYGAFWLKPESRIDNKKNRCEHVQRPVCGRGG